MDNLNKDFEVKNEKSLKIMEMKYRQIDETIVDMAEYLIENNFVSTISLLVCLLK